MSDTPETLLSLPPGAQGTGRIRYGAAMALYAEGRLSPAALEAWRIASAADHRNPLEVLAPLGLTLPQPPQPDPSTLLSTLADETARYLATRSGPGIAELRRLISSRAGCLAPPRATAHPVVDTHLPAALAHLTPTHPALARAIAAAAPHLGWQSYDQYDPQEIGLSFAQGHAYAPLLGPDAPFPSKTAELGLFLIAPHVLYRDHAHAAAELYAPLTGPHGWRFGPNRPLITKPAHVPVWNDPHRPHLIKTGPTPFLCLFGWLSDLAAPAYVLAAEDWDALERLRLDASA
jgi:hypothetical protein